MISQNDKDRWRKVADKNSSVKSHREALKHEIIGQTLRESKGRKHSGLCELRKDSKDVAIFCPLHHLVHCVPHYYSVSPTKHNTLITKTCSILLNKASYYWNWPKRNFGFWMRLTELSSTISQKMPFSLFFFRVEVKDKNWSFARIFCS